VEINICGNGLKGMTLNLIIMRNWYWSNLFDFSAYLIETHLPMKYHGSREWEYAFNPKDENGEVKLCVWTADGEFQVDYNLTLMEAFQVRTILKTDPCLKRETVEKVSLN
jgi:hypothetical protein